MNLFSPDYGAASNHIAELVKEREDFVLASRAQAARSERKAVAHAPCHPAGFCTDLTCHAVATLHPRLAVAALEKQVSVMSEDLQAAHEQLEVTRLISESRARQLEEQNTTAEATQAKLDRMRSAVYTLWGLMQEQQMRVREQEGAVKAGSDLLESLSELLAEPKASPAKPGANGAGAAE